MAYLPLQTKDQTTLGLYYIPLQTSSNNSWLISLYKQYQTTLGLSPFTNKFKQHLAYLPLQTSSNNTWLISLYKQVQTTLGLSPFTNKIKQHLDCLPSPNQVKATLTIKYQTIYKLPMGDETFMFPMNSRHHKTEYGYIVVFVFYADMADLLQFAT